jgi:hypothetical protein
MQHNHFTGSSVLEGSYNMLTSLDISFNQIGGAPTINLEIMPMLQRLFMSSNAYTDTIVRLDPMQTWHPFKSIGTTNSFRESDALRIDVNTESLTAALSDLEQLEPSEIKAL